MIELGTVWKRRMNAPGYLPHLARIDKKMTKILFARDHGGNIRDVHILTFVELAKYYTEGITLRNPAIPGKKYVEKARKILALQASKPIIAHGAAGRAIRKRMIAFLR